VTLRDGYADPADRDSPPGADEEPCGAGDGAADPTAVFWLCGFLPNKVDRQMVFSYDE